MFNSRNLLFAVVLIAGYQPAFAQLRIVPAQLPTLAQNELVGRNAAGTGDQSALTAAQVRTLLNVVENAHNTTLATSATDITATAAEVNYLDVGTQTVGYVLAVQAGGTTLAFEAQAGAGGGTTMKVDTGSDLSTADFQDGGDIGFTDTAGVITADLNTGVADLDKDLSPQLGADLDLNSKAFTGIYTAAVTMADGDLVYMNSSGKMALADADAEATTKGMMGIATEAITVDTTGTFVLMGNYTTTGLTTGGTYYVSFTAGDFTTTVPSGASKQIRVVGFATSTTNLFFNPSSLWAETLP